MITIGTYNNIEIQFGDELVNLTNMWKACGSKKSQRPYEWLALPETNRFLESLDNEFKGQKIRLLKTVKGRYGGTYGHYQIALAYAKYLSPTFHAGGLAVSTFVAHESDHDHTDEEAGLTGLERLSYSRRNKTSIP